MDNLELIKDINGIPNENTLVILGYAKSIIGTAFHELDDIYGYNNATVKNDYLDSSADALNAILMALLHFIDEAKNQAEASETQILRIRSRLKGENQPA